MGCVRLVSLDVELIIGIWMIGLMGLMGLMAGWVRVDLVRGLGAGLLGAGGVRENMLQDVGRFLNLDFWISFAD